MSKRTTDTARKIARSAAPADYVIALAEVLGAKRVAARPFDFVPSDARVLSNTIAGLGLSPESIGWREVLRAYLNPSPAAVAA